MHILRHEASDDAHAYWAAIKAAWEAGEPFINLEPDVTAGDDVIARFESCSEPWCFNSYAVPKNAHEYDAVDNRCQVVECGRTAHNHPSDPNFPSYINHNFVAADLSCAICGTGEHAPLIPVQIADLGGAALGCSRFRPVDLPDVFAHEMLSDAVHWANLDVHITTVLRLAGHFPHRHTPNVGH